MNIQLNNVNRPLVTVIVPIYKVEKYIGYCAESLFAQTYSEIEYIFVNDCTPDKSVDIVRAVLEKYPERKLHVRFINNMINQGLEKEVRNLLEKYSEFPTAMQGLGYKEVVEYFNGILTRGEMIDKIKQESRRYAKRQLTWFRRNKEIIWLDANEEMEKNIKTILERLE